MNCNTTHYRANSSSVPGDPTTELLAMEQNLDGLLPQESENVDTWVERLRALRFPETTARTLSAEAKNQGRAWPRFVASRWLRQGDQTAIEVKFSVKTKAELKMRLETLRRFADELDEEPLC